jgi:exonuclease III
LFGGALDDAIPACILEDEETAAASQELFADDGVVEGGVLVSLVRSLVNVFVPMYERLVIWNARGLNRRARRTAVQELVRSETTSFVCLQETKLDVLDDALVKDMLGLDSDSFALLAVHTCGGILVAWDSKCWSVSSPILGSHSLSVKVALCANPDATWWLTNVYGPQGDAAKVGFLQELCDLRPSLSDPWAICGDFNLIYQAVDKSNGHLSRRMMGRFRRLLNDLELFELHLSGRLFTWSNEQLHPTLERIDRMFVSEGLESLYPCSYLQALLSHCSNHAPLLLQFDDGFNPKRRFRFQAFWPQVQGYLDTVKVAWSPPLPLADPLCTIDQRLRETAKGLKAWSAKSIGSIRTQVLVAKEVIFCLDAAQDHRSLSLAEFALCKFRKLCYLGLTSLKRTIARERSSM